MFTLSNQSVKQKGHILGIYSNDVQCLLQEIMHSEHIQTLIIPPAPFFSFELWGKELGKGLQPGKKILEGKEEKNPKDLQIGV